MSIWNLKPVTETSWILECDDIRHSMVLITPDGLKILGPLERKTFTDTSDLQNYLGSKVTIEARDDDSESGDEIAQVDGYPIKHGSAFDIEKDLIITYAKAIGSKVRFAAGYYAIDFEHGWTASYCPRTNTLATHGYIGPFRTKLEMQNAISAKKREVQYER